MAPGRHRRLCAGIIQKHWLHDAIVIPLLLSMLVVAVL